MLEEKKYIFNLKVYYRYDTTFTSCIFKSEPIVLNVADVFLMYLIFYVISHSPTGSFGVDVHTRVSEFLPSFGLILVSPPPSSFHTCDALLTLI